MFAVLVSVVRSPSVVFRRTLLLTGGSDSWWGENSGRAWRDTTLAIHLRRRMTIVLNQWLDCLPHGNQTKDLDTHSNSLHIEWCE